MPLGEKFQAAGVREEQARAPAVVSLEWLQTQCDQLERVLRLQTDWYELSAPYLSELETLKPETSTRALQRWALLKHLYRVRDQGLRREAEAAPEDAQEAAVQLLRREPVRVTLESGREVAVTSRSISAMMELAAHHARIRLLERDLDRAGEVYRDLIVELEASPVWSPGRTRLRRRARRVEDIHRRLHQELHQHRWHLYAHALTPTGAPAGPDDHPPTWWVETTAADDARILFALYEAGPLRYRRLGPPPERKKQDGKPAEDWGYSGLLAAWGIRKRVDPARMLDQDLAQAMTEMRMAAPPTLEEELEG